MKILYLLRVLFLANLCAAGPLFVAIADLLVELAPLGTEATLAASLAASPIASVLGVGLSGIWFESFVVVNGALYYGSAVAGAGVLTGSIATGAGIPASAAVKDKKKSSSVMAAISKSMSSAIAAIASSVRESAKSHSSIQNDLTTSQANAIASAKTQATLQTYDPAKDPFKFSTHKRLAVRSGTSVASSQPTQMAPLPSASPVGSLAPDQRPPGLPEGVNLYNFQMCQNAIIHMNVTGKMLLFDQPGPGSLLMTNVPPECMVLADHMLPFGSLGPHPIPMSEKSLQWNGVANGTIDLVRQVLGVPFLNGSSSEIKGAFSDKISRWKI